MQLIGRYLWTSFFLFCATLLIAGWALHHNGIGLPAKLVSQLSEPLSAAATSISPPKRALPSFSNPLPSSRTYYQWTDKDGNVGYSLSLPEQVESYRAIVLQGDENTVPAIQPSP